MMEKTYRDLLEYFKNCQDDTIIIGVNETHLPLKLGIYEQTVNIYSNGEVATNDRKTNSYYFPKLGNPVQTITDYFLMIKLDSTYDNNCMGKVAPTVGDWKSFLSSLPSKLLDQPILVYVSGKGRAVSLNLLLKDRLGFGKYYGMVICGKTLTDVTRWDDCSLYRRDRGETLEHFKSTLLGKLEQLYDLKHCKIFNPGNIIALCMGEYVGEPLTLKDTRKERHLIPDFVYNPETYERVYNIQQQPVPQQENPQADDQLIQLLRQYGAANEIVVDEPQVDEDDREEDDRAPFDADLFAL